MPPTYSASFAFTGCRHAATSSPTTTGTIGMMSNPAGAPPRARNPASSHSRNIMRSEEHTSELQSRLHLVCRLLLEKKKISQQDSPSFNHHTALPAIAQPNSTRL